MDKFADISDEATFIQTALAVAVQWIIVPLILLSVFNMARRLAKTAKEPDLKASAWAGLWAGLVIFVIIVASQLQDMRAADFGPGFFPRLSSTPLILGFILGFLILLGVRRSAPTRMIGLITMLLSSASSSALFSYVFMVDMRGPLLYSTLGLAVGVLVHITIFPASINAMFTLSEKTSPPAPDAVKQSAATADEQKEPQSSRQTAGEVDNSKSQ
jgi:hypothetical protein